MAINAGGTAKVLAEKRFSPCAFSLYGGFFCDLFRNLYLIILRVFYNVNRGINKKAAREFLTAYKLTREGCGGAYCNRSGD